MFHWNRNSCFSALTLNRFSHRNEIIRFLSFMFVLFLTADTQLHKRLCLSVCPSVRWSNSPSAGVEKWVNAHICPCPPFLVAVYPASDAPTKRAYWLCYFSRGIIESIFIFYGNWHKEPGVLVLSRVKAIRGLVCSLISSYTLGVVFSC